MNSIFNPENYPICCDSINESLFFVKDNINCQSALSNKNDYHVKVVNKNQQNLSFLKIDKCVFNDNDSSKCDFLIANYNVNYFVEIKELKLFKDFESHTKRNKKRIEARKQLSNTINNLKLKHTNLDLKNVFAIIALQPELKDNYTKIITSKEQNVINSFIESCGCPNIYEGNVIEFK